MAKKRPRQVAHSGWQGEADAEDIDRMVEPVIRTEGRKLYQDKYHKALQLKQEGVTDDEIRSRLKHPLPDPRRFKSLTYTVHLAAEDKTEKVKADISQQAIEDAIAGKPEYYQEPSFL